VDRVATSMQLTEKTLKDFGEGVGLSCCQDSLHRIYILKMSAKDNRFNPKFCEALDSALSFILADSEEEQSLKFALIVTGSGKFFSNGLDLQFLMQSKDPNQFLITHYEPLICRFLTLGMPTVAAVNGHAFAGGMCLALAQDYRLALNTPTTTKTLLSMNELLIRASIPAGMLAVLRAKLSGPQVLRDCIFAKRWTIQEALQDKIIDGECESFEGVLEFARAKAIEGKHIQVLHSIKRETYREASNLLLDPKSDSLDPFRFAIPKPKL
jgi:Delta3-Delta2-enoyl-CoA isomerase